jgi:peptide deformylase
MVQKIRLYGDKILRQMAEPVSQITNNNIKKISNELSSTLRHYRGLGLAAPQIGYSLRMFALYPLWEEDEKKRKIMIFINPTLLEFAGEQNEEEGCLSIPDIFEKVRRAQIVRFKAQNLYGKWKEYKADGLFARAVQHEYDHLDGILFIDKISPFWRRLLQGKLKKISSSTNIKNGVNIG